MKKLVVAFVVGAFALLNAQLASAQDEVSQPFGKGLINVIGKDSSWSTKLAMRFQTRYEGDWLNNTDTTFTGPQYTERWRVRRARIKASGFAFNPKVRYKFEYDVHNGFVLDAVLKWKFAGNWDIWFGQTKLPGNIERVFSSQKLQLVDRSLLNSRFTLDRDAGIQLRHHFYLGKTFLVREKFAYSQGEGLNQTGYADGNGYTARIELLPFGKFTKKGDYFAADLKREEDPKLMLSITYDYNVNARRVRGRMGDYITGTPRDLQTIHADFHFKWKGFSAFGEYAQMEVTDGSPILAGTMDSLGVYTDVSEAYFTGSAINLQMGYLFKNNWELAARYTTVTPEALILEDNVNQYTFGFSKYVVGHNLKVQGDVTLQQQDNADDHMFFRLQTEFNF